MLVALSLNLWWGKAAGLMLGGVLSGAPGAWLGLLLGHAFDMRLRIEPFEARVWRGDPLPAADSRFFAAAFGLIGRMLSLGGTGASALAVAHGFIEQLGLTPTQQRVAVALIEHGGEAGLPVEILLRRLEEADGGAFSERREWLSTCLFAVAAAGGPPSLAQGALLRQIAARLQEERGEADARTERAEASVPPLLRPSLESAFGLLDVDAMASVAEIKRAYRRAVARYHPDRLLAKGASEPELREANELTREIRSAFDDIRSARGF